MKKTNQKKQIKNQKSGSGGVPGSRAGGGQLRKKLCQNEKLPEIGSVKSDFDEK